MSQQGVVKKRKGAGGAWRVYVRQTTGGMQGLADMKRVAQQYKNIKRQGGTEFKGLQVAGQASTITSHTRQAQGHSRATRVSAGRQMRRLALQSFASTHQGLPQPRVCEAALERGSVSMKGLSLAIALANRTAREATMARRRRLEEARHVVDAYQREQREKVLPQLFKRVPLDMHDMVWWPLGAGVNAVKVKAEAVVPHAVNACHWMSQNRNSNLSTAIDSYWDDLHSTVNDYKKHSTKTVHRPTLCETTGVCHCSPGGKLLRKFTRALHTVQKQVFHEAHQKEFLAKAYVILFLQSKVPTQLLEKSRPLVHDEVWYHIGLQYFSPYRSTYHKLERLPDIHPGFVPLPQANARVLLQVSLRVSRHRPPIPVMVFSSHVNL